jgi:glycosyltransferase involved in cell wall biosynthesis/peptidoglycan/xylan/chitin deacetylase (PgdA/CDA1 family)/SAM-dependent methyltransferase
MPAALHMRGEMSNTPLVSAIMIFFNGEAYMREAIESVLKQQFEDWELILIDDGSTDGGTELAHSFAQQYPGRIRYFEHEGHRNLGMSASRNAGFRNARGKYFALLDCDDVWLPEKLARQAPYMEEHPEVGMLIAASEYWYSWSGKQEDFDRDIIREIGVEPGIYDPPSLATRLYPLGTAPAPCQCGLLIRADAISRVGGYEESFRGFYEDQAFLIKMYLSERIAISRDCWDRYRIHEGSCSAAVRQAHEYDAYRARFLHWLREYLDTIPSADSDVLAAVNNALSQYRPAADHQTDSGWLRLLRVADGNEARLEYPHDNPDAVRIAIAETQTHVSYDIQMNLPRIPVSANHRYALSLLARADKPRNIGIGFAQGHAPWQNLGLYSQIDLGTDWQEYQWTFTAGESDENARIHIDAGESDIPVEITAIALRNLTEGRFVKPGLRLSQSAAAVSIPIEPIIDVGRVNFGSLRRLTPISQDFGCDRGHPVDRHYIEQYMAAQAEYICGRVLEIGDRTYTRRYGGDRVTHSDMLHITEGEPEATIIADLASADHIPSDTFDCVIFTQTLQLIYDFKAAIATIHRILKPGGVLLATFPGISQSYDSEWGETWYWNFTGLSARRLFGDVFTPDGVRVQTFGNVLAAISFLHGIAKEELTVEELNYRDPGYDITIAIRAQKQPHDSDARKPSRSISAPDGAAGKRGLILMYHRVIDVESDPWALCVSPENFEQHLKFLSGFADIIPLSELPAAIGHSRRLPVAITFDDGYADNILFARPLLEKFGAPATVFVISGYLDRPREFWWDELESILLLPGELPITLDLVIGETQHHWDFGNAASYSPAEYRCNAGWKAPANPPTLRHSAYAELWRALQPLPEATQRETLDTLRKWAGMRPGIRSTHRGLTPDELIALATGNLVEIGAHTVTHPIISSLPIADQIDELRQSKVRLEKITGQYVTSFSYPYGTHDAEVMGLVKRAGFMRACLTIESCVAPKSDPFRLPRVEVQNWDVKEFQRRFQFWLHAPVTV